MCYKIEVQRKNEEKLQKKFDEENISLFIQKYFINIESKAGAINYWVAIRDLLLWLMEKKIIKKSTLSDIEAEDFYDVESEDILLYLTEKQKSGLSRATLTTRKNIFRSFWNYLERTKKCPVEKNIIKDVKYRGVSTRNNLVVKLPSEEQIRRMEEKISNKNDVFLRTRNLTILRLLKGSGIREAELSGLDKSDLFLEAKIPYIKIIGKGAYEPEEAREVQITGDAKRAIEEWLEIRDSFVDDEDTKAVFITKKGRRIATDEIGKMFKAMSNKELSPHMIRHYYATIMAKKGGIAFVQQQLGHSSESTTINNYANGSYGMKDILASM